MSAVPVTFVADSTGFGSVNVPPGAIFAVTRTGSPDGKTDSSKTRSNGMRAR